MLAELHNLLSKLLREYPDLWRPRLASQKGLYEEFRRRLSEKLNYRLTITRLISTLQGIRKAIIKLEEESSHTVLTSYAWYAEELGCEQAAKTMKALLARQKAAREETCLAKGKFSGEERLRKLVNESKKEKQQKNECGTCVKLLSASIAALS
ncbi:hypothetical protein GQX74_013859 [Glossina fuscipes]|nr:hypothetical protein GQX74_013859 [Glossina fuscipes]